MIEGLRDRPSKKTSCTWQVIFRCPRSTGQWEFQVHGSHNHGRNLYPSAPPCFRKLSPRQLDVIRNLSMRPGHRPREIFDAARDAEPNDELRHHFKMRDIYNAIARIRRERLDGLTPTAAFVEALHREGAIFRQGHDAEGRLDRLF